MEWSYSFSTFPCKVRMCSWCVAAPNILFVWTTSNFFCICLLNKPSNLMVNLRQPRKTESVIWHYVCGMIFPFQWQEMKLDLNTERKFNRCNFWQHVNGQTKCTGNHYWYLVLSALSLRYCGFRNDQHIIVCFSVVCDSCLSFIVVCACACL